MTQYLKRLVEKHVRKSKIFFEVILGIVLVFLYIFLYYYIGWTRSDPVGLGWADK
jgi:hypothetical protein